MIGEAHRASRRRRAPSFGHLTPSAHPPWAAISAPLGRVSHPIVPRAARAARLILLCGGQDFVRTRRSAAIPARDPDRAMPTSMLDPATETLEPLTLPGWNIGALDADVVHFVRHGLEAIEGWGVDPYLAGLFLALDRFQKANGVTGNLFELGVHHGRSAVLIALMAAPDEQSVFLDLFGRQAENIDFSGLGNREIFEANLATWAPGRRYDAIEANSLELDFAATPMLSGGLRFAHIDGGHHRDAVLNDLFKTEAAMVEGGVVVMDDFAHTGFPEVSEACNFYLERREANRLTPVALGHNKLVLVTRRHQARLFAFLERLGAANDPPVRAVRFHGEQVICLDAH
jgi:hypothetical protein